MVTADLLITKGKSRGFVTTREVTALFPDPDVHLDEIDTLCLALLDLGIDIVSGPSIRELIELIEPEPEPVPVPALERPAVAESLYDLYMSEIRRIDLLTAGEEVELAKLICKGEAARLRLGKKRFSYPDRARLQEQVEQGEEARHRFATANLRLVASVAWRYRDKGIPMLDLIQEGNIGLLRAIEKWDHRRGYKFSTYATWWIRQTISRALVEQGTNIRIPVHVHEVLPKIKRFSNNFLKMRGRKPTTQEIAQGCAMEERRVVRIVETVPEECSLDALLCCPRFPLEYDATATGVGFVQRQPCPVWELAMRRWYLMDQEEIAELPVCLAEPNGPESECETHYVDYSFLSWSWCDSASPPDALPAELREAIQAALAQLRPREARIIRKRYGFDGEEQTLEEVGQSFGLTRERIRQIEVKALRILRFHARYGKLWSFWYDTD